MHEAPIKNINYGKAQEFVFRSTACRFFDEFRACNTNLKDKLRSGRPHEVDREATIEAIKEDPTLVVRNWQTMLIVVMRQSAEY
ncbi:hypothetical protein KIN20_001606 [Parelaphostrongylus tenuis]|uniref:Uncharacterized protein n=1 Tax=Parelaphostrongylus tenuis TaxID=148309 RepID=A0AAD5MCT6_PARTN|nr:hypothetical protein KIN20_001606 [Parelaphostrongylus tenuis]